MTKFLIVLPVVLLLAAGCNAATEQNKPVAQNQQREQLPKSTANKPAVQKPKDNTANWKTYTNTALAFSIKYPPSGWSIEQSNQPEVGVVIYFRHPTSEDPKNRDALRVEVTDKTLSQWLNSVPNHGQPTELTIDDQKAIKVSAPGFSSDQTLIAAIYKGKLYEFHTDHNEIIDNGMLGTFKFTK